MDASRNQSGPTRDHSKLAGWYLIVLGVVCLLSCNLTGFLFIWFGARVGARDETFRRASLVLLGLYLVADLGLVLWAALFGTENFSVYLFMHQLKAPAKELVFLAAAAMLVIFGLPFYWLCQDSYRSPLGKVRPAEPGPPDNPTVGSAG
jgi:hypothetical protein